MQKLLLYFFVIVLGACANRSSADLYVYSWTGYFENRPGMPNPWQVTGDGYADTPTDGTPFKIKCYLDSSALDTTFLSNQAIYNIGNACELITDGEQIKVSDAVLRFVDWSGFDFISLTGNGTRYGTTLPFIAGMFIPDFTFDLSDNSDPDTPPLFAPFYTVSHSGGGNGSSIINEEPAGMYVSVTAVPEPSLVVPLLVSMVGVPTWKRFKTARKPIN